MFSRYTSTSPPSKELFTPMYDIFYFVDKYSASSPPLFVWQGSPKVILHSCKPLNKDLLESICRRFKRYHIVGGYFKGRKARWPGREQCTWGKEEEIPIFQVSQSTKDQIMCTWPHDKSNVLMASDSAEATPFDSYSSVCT